MNNRELEKIFDFLRERAQEEIEIGLNLCSRGDKGNGLFREGLGRGILIAIHEIEGEIMEREDDDDFT